MSKIKKKYLDNLKPWKLIKNWEQLNARTWGLVSLRFQRWVMNRGNGYRIFWNLFVGWNNWVNSKVLENGIHTFLELHDLLLKINKVTKYNCTFLILNLHGLSHKQSNMPIEFHVPTVLCELGFGWMKIQFPRKIFILRADCRAMFTFLLALVRNNHKSN